MCKRFVCVLLGSWSPEAGRPGVGKIEGPIPRSGVDSVGRSAPDAAANGPTIEPASFLTSLCARRLDFCRGMNFRMLQRWRGDKRIRGAWLVALAFHFQRPHARTGADHLRRTRIPRSQPTAFHLIPSFCPTCPTSSACRSVHTISSIHPVVNLRHESSKSINQHISVGIDPTY
jgi:hypothetical protein